MKKYFVVVSIIVERTGFDSFIWESSKTGEELLKELQEKCKECYLSTFNAIVNIKPLDF